MFDPSNNSPICKIPRSNKSDVNLAVQSAQNSLSSNWGSFSSLERGRILNKIGLLVQDKIDRLAKIESLDVGKPLTQSKADASALARYLEFYLELLIKFMVKLFLTKMAIQSILKRTTWCNWTYHPMELSNANNR